MVDYEDMGKRIKIKRRQKRMSQETLANAVNISPSYFGNIERGTRIPSIDTLVAIANVLGVGTDFFLANSLDAVRSKLSQEEMKRLSRFLRERMDELIYDTGDIDDEVHEIIYDPDTIDQH